MFDKNIEFSTHEDYFNLKEDYPVPIKLNIPDWYKKLEHTILDRTIKGCIPFLDTLTTGYLFKMPQDFHLRHNVPNKEENNRPDAFQHFALGGVSGHLNAKFINLNSDSVEAHPTRQLGECPYVEKNKNLAFHKMINPWRIKTPKGYSCLFVPPLNNTDDRFSIIPGIVDTDSFQNEVNFPIVVNGDKYPTLDTVIKKGTPYVQVIPFKRDSWKMTFKPIPQKEITASRIFYGLKILHNYKNRFWKKKSWN